MTIKIGFIITWLIITFFMVISAGIDIFFLIPVYLGAMTGSNEGIILVVIGYLIMIGWFSLFFYVCYTVIRDLEG